MMRLKSFSNFIIFSIVVLSFLIFTVDQSFCISTLSKSKEKKPTQNQAQVQKYPRTQYKNSKNSNNSLSTSFNHSALPQSYYKFISVNEIKMWIANNGNGSHHPLNDGSGFFWPGGDDAVLTSVFEDGFVYGGTVDSMVNVNGSTFRSGWQPGNILEDGTVADPNDSVFKIWKINKDWEVLPPGTLRDELDYDYNNWPVEYGAPWVDVDSDGIFTRNIDKPEFLGDEVLFHVSNDLNPDITEYVYGSPPIGLEFQVTVWAHKSYGFLKDVVFKKYVVINKGNKTINDCYFTYWTDDDLGFAGDDYVGCDSTLNLGYTYNSDNNDDDFFGTNPPVVGHMMIQGPIVPSTPDDSAKIKNKWKRGYTNLGLSSFTPGFKSGTLSMTTDPPFGYEGAIETYNLMQGLRNNSEEILDPHTTERTLFPLSGDPLNQIGWYEGGGWPSGSSPGDRRYYINSGPFTFSPGDTQEVVYAIFMARRKNNLESIDEGKNTARTIQNYWDNIIYTDIENDDYSILTASFELNQNYPNPFNPTTTIKYSIPHGLIPSGDEGWLVQLSFYDILGRELKTLVNKQQKPGNYEVQFDASILSSGMYFYRLKSDNFVQTKKMLLIK